MWYISMRKNIPHELSHSKNGAIFFECLAYNQKGKISFLIFFVLQIITVTLRSVTKIERAFALGLQLVIMRLLAYIPSPLIFGKAIEWTCLVWRRDECNQVGSCLFYDREQFRHIYGSKYIYFV